MRKLILAARSGLLRSAVVATPLVIASACSESGGNFFTPTTGGTGGVMSGGSGGVGKGGGAGNGSGGTANTTSGGMGGTGGGSVAGTGGMTTGGTAGSGGTGGDAPTAGTGGTDATGGTAGSDASGGEGGTGNEGGMDPTAGTAGSMGGDAGSSTVAGASGSGGGGDAGTGGVAGLGGGAGAGMGGIGGMAGTGGSGCVPKTEVCDGEDNDCGDDTDEGGVCPSGCHGATFGGRTFLLCTVNNSVEWDEALDICQGLATDSAPVAVAGPMTLVQVDSVEENDFLKDWIVALNIDVSVWLGANDAQAEGRWFWDRGTGSPVAFLTVINNNRTIIDGRYNDFPSGTFMPASGDCARFDPAEDLRWNDRSCTMATDAFICGEIP